ncbi:ferrochelatase [Stenoxybacter acetivorans]|uniref:ferrochelatase n=1 Tax=Stenoxybacter acetivorans TaxID=422441 RepID=UPI00056D99AA|nr:ferrochelatase [Stenoxybacter acetivorans]
MKPYFFPEPPANTPKIGVLLLNLGTPKTPETKAVRPYLREFLSDRRVVELPRFMWQTLLNGIILPLRSPKSAHGYQKIWLPEGAPLLRHTQNLCIKLHRQLADFDAQIITDYAMTYGEPSVECVIANLKQQGVDRLLVLPLYPQYAASSSAAALDKVWHVLLRQRRQMAVRSITGYADNANYIAALAAQIEHHWQQHGRGDKLLFSFHGIPQAQNDNGDPYAQECQTTVRLLAEKLRLPENKYLLAYQSRFGKAKWLTPSTQDLLQSLPQSGVRKLDIICPGFAADCLETLEEIAVQGRNDFLAAGGVQFHYIPCLNDDNNGVNALASLIKQHLAGWLA